jgi:hypothetical protein
VKKTKKPAPASKRVEIPKKKPANRTRARGKPTKLAPKPPKDAPGREIAVVVAPREYSEAEYIAAIRLKYPPEVVTAKIDRLLEAKRTYTTGSGKIVEHDDTATQAKGLEILLNRVLGKPLDQPEITKTTKATSFADLKERAQKSAPFKESLIEMLQELTQS